MWADIRTAFWLRTRHFAFSRTQLIGLFLVWAAYLYALGWAANYAYTRDALTSQIIIDGLTLVWLLWALLPAFGGGGEMDQPRYLDIYPMRKTFLVASAITSVILDVQYQIIAPIVLAGSYAVWGLGALPYAVLFIVGAGAIGQICVWSVTAKPSLQWLTMSFLAAILVGAAIVLRTHPQYGPAGWLVAALDNPENSWAYVALLTIPLFAFALVIRPLSKATLNARGERAGVRRMFTGFGFVNEIVQTHLYGVWRSNTAKVTLFSCVIIPIVIGSALPGATAGTVLAFVIGAGGAAVATNSYAYDHTGTLSLLGWPKTRARLLTAKLLTTMAWFIILAIPATAMSLAIGLELNQGNNVGVFLLTVLTISAAATASGIGASIRRPAEADHDTLRVRPAPVPSVLGYGIRMMILLGLLAPLRDPGYPAGAALIGGTLFLGFVTWSVWWSYRAFVDSAALCAAFKV